MSSSQEPRRLVSAPAFDAGRKPAQAVRSFDRRARWCGGGSLVTVGSCRTGAGTRSRRRDWGGPAGPGRASLEDRDDEERPEAEPEERREHDDRGGPVVAPRAAGRSPTVAAATRGADTAGLVPSAIWRITPPTRGRERGWGGCCPGLAAICCLQNENAPDSVARQSRVCHGFALPAQAPPDSCTKR